MAELIDPTQIGNYPVILGDGLLGKASNDIFTGMRYNHKPSETEAGTNRNARLKPSIQGQTSSYDLAINDRDNRPEYAFAGTRDLSSNQYVLYFDPEREAFILDRIDSTFNMNVTRIPGNSDQDSLSRKYPQIDTNGLTSGSSGGSTVNSNLPNSHSKKKVAATKTTAAVPSEPAPKPKARAKSPPPPRKKEAPLSKPKTKLDKKDTKKAVGGLIELALPTKAEKPKPKPKPKTRNLDEEEEEDDEVDDGLLIEYPGGEPKGPKRDFSPALKSIRRFDDFMDQRESEADDADGESESEPEIVDFKLPSPVNHPAERHGQGYGGIDAMDEDVEEEDDAGHHDGAAGGGGVDDNLEDDLEKDLEMAFEEEAVDNSYNGTPANEDVDESEISEED